MKSALRGLFWLAAAAAVPAQAGEAPPPPAGAAADVSIRLRPGTTWREGVRLQTDYAPETGAPSRWTLDYKLRLRCADEADGEYTVEAVFIDWLLRLEHGDHRYEWHDGKFRVERGAEEGGEDAAAMALEEAAVEQLLTAWSRGLRLADVHYSMNRGGLIQRLRGLEKLHEEVRATLADQPLLPAEIGFHFGEAGLERANCALFFALSVPRPAGEMTPGCEWQDVHSMPGIMPGICEMTRRFRFEETGQERHYRYAALRLEFETRQVLEDGEMRVLQPVRAPAEPNRVRLLLDSGLVYDLRVALVYPALSGGVAGFELVAQLLD